MNYYCTVCYEANSWNKFEDGICDACWEDIHFSGERRAIDDDGAAVQSV